MNNLYVAMEQKQGLIVFRLRKVLPPLRRGRDWSPTRKTFLLPFDLNQILRRRLITYINYLCESMLVSRLVTRALALRPAAAFAYIPSNSSSLSHIQSKALSTRSLPEFTRLVNSNPKEFTGEVLGSVSRHLGGLINRERLNFGEAKELLKVIEAIDASSLSLRNAISLLSVLRNLKSRGFQAPILTIRNAIAGRYLALLQERESTEQDLGDLVNALAELTFFRMREGRVVVERLLKVLEAGSKAGSEAGRVRLGDSQITYMLWTLSMRPELSNLEQRLRSLVLRELGKQLAAFKLEDLVRAAVNINKMDLFDLEASELSLLRQVSDRIFASITDLDERTIYDLIRADNTGKLPGFFRIYEEVNRNIFAEIDERGESELGHDAILRVLIYLADKLPLYRLSEVEKKKFFAFLDGFARECVKDESKGQQVGFKVRDLVAKNYFAGEQKNVLVRLLQSHGIRLNVITLYDMAVRDYDISPFAADIFKYTPDNLHDEFLVKLGVIASHLLKLAPSPEAKALFEAIQAKIADQVATPEGFLEYYKKLRRMELKLMNFHDVFGELVQRLPNPLESTVDVAGYRRVYLEYTHDAARSREYGQFFAKHEEAISGEELGELLSHHVRMDPRELESRRPVVQLLNKRIYELIDSRSKKQVEAVLDFVAKYSRFVIGGSLDANSCNSIFRMLHCLIGKLDIVEEVGFGSFFFATLERYISKNHKNYNNEYNYRELVNHLASRINKIQEKKHHLATTVVKEGLRLGLLTHKHLETVNVEKLGLSFFERSRALYVKDGSYAPAIDKVTTGVLDVIFSNRNLENLLVEHEKNIIEILQGTNAHNLCNYLSLYCHNKSPASKRILSEILNAVVTKNIYFDRINFSGIFQNALDHNIFYFSQYRKLTEKVVEHFKSKIGWWSIDTHLSLIRFIVSQPGLNPSDYYNELVAFAEKREDISEGQFEQLLLRLATTNYRFKATDLEYVEKIVKKNPYNGIYFFLMVENLLEAETRKKVVREFVEKYNGNEEKREKKERKEQTLSRHYYLYLKKKYPEETAALSIEDKSLFNETLLAKPRNTELINTIIKLAGGQSEEVKILGAQNYLLKINEYVLAFLISKRVGSYYEHQFVKRAISAIHGEELTTVCLFIGNQPSTTLEYINKQCPKLFNQVEYEKALAEFKANIRKKAEPVTEV